MTKGREVIAALLASMLTVEREDVDHLDPPPPRLEVKLCHNHKQIEVEIVGP